MGSGCCTLLQTVSRGGVPRCRGCVYWRSAKEYSSSTLVKYRVFLTGARCVCVYVMHLFCDVLLYEFEHTLNVARHACTRVHACSLFLPLSFSHTHKHTHIGNSLPHTRTYTRKLRVRICDSGDFSIMYFRTSTQGHYSSPPSVSRPAWV